MSRAAEVTGSDISSQITYLYFLPNRGQDTKEQPAIRVGFFQLVKTQYHIHISALRCQCHSCKPPLEFAYAVPLCHMQRSADDGGGEHMRRAARLRPAPYAAGVRPAYRHVHRVRH